jgi:hypothetical protein
MSVLANHQLQLLSLANVDFTICGGSGSENVTSSHELYGVAWGQPPFYIKNKALRDWSSGDSKNSQKRIDRCNGTLATSTV